MTFRLDSQQLTQSKMMAFASTALTRHTHTNPGGILEGQPSTGGVRGDGASALRFLSQERAVGDGAALERRLVLGGPGMPPPPRPAAEGLGGRHRAFNGFLMSPFLGCTV